MRQSTIVFLLLFTGLAPLRAGTLASVDKNPAPTEPPPTFGGSLWERSKLTGNWGGFRDDLAVHGITIDLNTVYTFQGVATGGTSIGHDTGNLFSGDLSLAIDTGKAGLWPGGFLKVRFEGRGGDNVLRKVGGVSPSNNDALWPNVAGRQGDSAWALTELSYTQFLSEQFGVTMGLLNTTGGDSNPIAGAMISNDHFLNSAFLYSAAETVVLPSVTLGGGLVFLPTKNIQGTLLAVGSTETAGNNPFDYYHGTTFVTEWTVKYELGQRPGGMTAGALYSVNRNRPDLAADPRLFFGSIVLNGKLITTDRDAWCLYWNGYQYLQGDEKKGWGVFGRFAFGDAETNPIRFNMSVGLGGTSPLPGRDADRWGAGFYYLDFAHLAVLDALPINHETGAELFYNISLTPWAHLTLDAQIVDSPLVRADTAVVLGTRLVINF